MVEAREEADGGSPPPPPPRSKKSRDHLDLAHCHACALHRPPRAPLRLLPSEWRVVLLCPPCLAALRSARLCSYCLSDAAAAQPLLDCRRCAARVHLRCVPLEQRCVAPADLAPGSFTCVDCDPLPRSLSRRSFRTSLEDVARDAACEAEKKILVAAKAREIALKKAAAASRAAERARTALDAVVVQQSEHAHLVLPDEELALQLHLAMNGSQRILRSRRPKSSGSSLNYGEVGVLGDSRVGEVEVCARVEVCTEDRAFLDSMKPIELDMSSSDLVTARNGDLKEVERQGVNGLADARVDEVHSIGDATSAELQRNESTRDRYSKKYIRRKSRLKEMIGGMDYHLAPCMQKCSSEVARTSSEVPCRTSVASMHSSTHANDLGRC